MTDATTAHHGLRSAQFWMVQAGIAVGWIGLWYVSALLEYAPHASLWYPPAALTYAVFRMFGLRGVPALIVASVAITRLQGIDPPGGGALAIVLSDGVIFIAHALPYALAALAMNQAAASGHQRAEPRTVTLFLVIGSLASLLAALLGTGALVVVGMETLATVAPSVTPWWIGDFAALLALGPPLMSLLGIVARRLEVPVSPLTPPISFLDSRSTRPLAFPGKLMLCVGMAAFSGALAARFPDNEPLAFVIFFVIIPQMWIVHSEGARRVLVSIATLSTTIAVVVWAFDLPQHALAYQFALLIIAASAYFGMAVPMLYADNRELRHLLTRDQLTGAATRHHFVDRARNEIQRAHRYDEPVCLATLDIDRFKQINDRFGHAAGDRALSEVARVSREQLRASDLLGRVGGDEFVILMPMSDLEQAEVVCQRLIDTVAALRFGDLPELEVTVSVGLTRIDTPRDSYEEAFERADAALYAAKRAGKNRVERG